jgi:hypothetical protein
MRTPSTTRRAQVLEAHAVVIGALLFVDKHAPPFSCSYFSGGDTLRDEFMMMIPLLFLQKQNLCIPMYNAISTRQSTDIPIHIDI